jgi:molybdopterin synthase catalytic subunit
MDDARYLTDAAIDRDRLIREVMRTSDGALVVFEGVVRDHHEGRAVESILYEAYRPMAEKEIGKIVSEVGRRFEDARIAVVHRLGLVRVGEISIAIACAAPHRGQAFDACRALIDRIKQTVPIWKKERGPEGEEWVGWQGSATTPARQ